MPSLKIQSSETFRKSTMNDDKNKHLLSAEKFSNSGYFTIQ